MRVAHAPGMPGTFSPPPRVSDPGMNQGTCVTHVPWCMPELLTSGFLWSRWLGKRFGIPSACATRNFAYLVRGPWKLCSPIYGSRARYFPLYERLYERFCLSVRPPVYLSVCHTLFTMFLSTYHHEIFNDKSDVHIWGQDQKSKSQGHTGQNIFLNVGISTVTQFLMQRWLRNDFVSSWNIPS